MYQTILVPLDGSELAEAILPHVEELAPHYGSTVVLLGVIELPHMVVPKSGETYDDLPSGSVDDLDARTAEAQAYLDRKANALCEKGIETRGRLEYGPVVTTIINSAREEDADLIAMASHGRGGLSDVYYGSVAAGILQRIDRPLLIVRATA